MVGGGGDFGARDAYLQGPISSNFYAVHFLPNNRCAHPFWEIINQSLHVVKLFRSITFCNS